MQSTDSLSSLNAEEIRFALAEAFEQKDEALSLRLSRLIDERQCALWRRAEEA